MLPIENDVPHKDEKLSHFDGVFKIISSKSNNEYCVDIVSGTCSCVKGETGNLCSHASAVVLYLENDIESGYNLVTNQTKELIYFIATGKH